MSVGEPLRWAALWLSGGANRARVRGARVQIVCLLLADRPQPSILLVRSRYGDWMPPQEGVRMKETFDAAFWRCLDEELAIVVADSERRRLLAQRGARTLGTLRLPRARHGERPVADDVEDGPLSHVTMRRKKYWSMCALVHDQARLTPAPRGTEITDAEWLTLPEAESRIRDTVRPEKARLLMDALAHGRLALHGDSS